MSQAVPRAWLSSHRCRASPGTARKGITFVLDGQAFPFCPSQDQLPSQAHNLEILLWLSLLARKKGAHDINLCFVDNSPGVWIGEGEREREGEQKRIQRVSA